MEVTLIRGKNSDQGILGQIFLNGSLFCYSIELPWRDNIRNRSCIPAGEYICLWKKSPTFGWCYTVTNVPNRSFIRIHHGNVAGNTDKGYKTNSYGCPLLGTTLGKLYNQNAVLASRIARSDFEAELNEEPFVLTVVGGLE